MSRSENQRLKLLFLRDYLLEHTYENHIVKTSDIIRHLQQAHNITVERKTVYTDMELLGENGYDMDIAYDAQTQGYKVIQREFEPYELQILIDSVQSSKFVTQKRAKEISDKLKKFVSRHDRPRLERQSYMPNRIRSDNDSVFNGIDDIHACIANNCKLSFKYFTYTVKKKKEYRKKGKPYIVSPFALLWNDNSYYLLAYERGGMKHFRVDKMDSIAAVDEEREGAEAFKSLNLSSRAAKVFSMYGGKEERVGLRFSNHLTGVVIDRFGKDIMMIPSGDKHFTVSVAVEVSPQFYGWLCGLGRAVKVLSPEGVVKDMSEYVAGIADMYRVDGNTSGNEPETPVDDEMT